jgi:hypothetical protein
VVAEEAAAEEAVVVAVAAVVRAQRAVRQQVVPQQVAPLAPARQVPLAPAGLERPVRLQLAVLELARHLRAAVVADEEGVEAASSHLPRQEQLSRSTGTLRSAFPRTIRRLCISADVSCSFHSIAVTPGA